MFMLSFIYLYNVANYMHKKAIFRYFLFVLVLIVLVPLLGYFFVKGGRLYSFDSVFLLSRFYLVWVVVLGVLLLLLRGKRVALGKVNYWFLGAGFLLIVSSLFFYSDFDKIQNVGFSIESEETVDKPGRVNFDASQFLDVYILTGIKHAYSSFVMDDNEFIEKRVFLEEIPEKPVIKLYAGWQDYPKTSRNLRFKGIDDNRLGSDVLVSVNNVSFDITAYVAELEEMEFSWFSVELADGVLKEGENKVSVYCKNCSDFIRVGAQDIFYEGDTYKFDGSEYNREIVDAVIFVKQENPLWFSILFRFVFIQRMLGILFIIIGLFGVGFFRFVFKKAKLELFFSTVFLFVIYYLNEIFVKFWMYLSKLTVYVVYFLLKITFLSPVLDTGIIEAPTIGSFNFQVQIADVCSGIESLGFFLLLYTIFLAFGWRGFDKRKALLFYVPGIVLTFLLNSFRIYFLIFIGTFISKNLALNLFHSLAAMLLFIGFFAVFLFWVNKYIKG